MRITVHGRPVAELVPLKQPRTFVPYEEIVEGLGGLLDPDDDFADVLAGMDEVAEDPFDR